MKSFYKLFLASFLLFVLVAPVMAEETTTTIDTTTTTEEVVTEETTTTETDTVTEETTEEAEVTMIEASEEEAPVMVRQPRKARHYRKFSGQLFDKKPFMDQGVMKHADAISFLQQRGVIHGYPDGTFGPERHINRAESLKVLLGAMGEEALMDGELSFSDVPADAWFAGYVRAAHMKGIVKGYEDGTFRPGDAVKQGELLKMVLESFGVDLTDYEVTNLPEGFDTTAWYAPYLQYALNNGLLTAEEVNLEMGMTREMFVKFVYGLIQEQEQMITDEEATAEEAIVEEATTEETVTEEGTVTEETTTEEATEETVTEETTQQ